MVAIISAEATAHPAGIRCCQVGHQMIRLVTGAPAYEVDIYPSIIDQAGIVSMPDPETPGPQGHDHREGESGEQRLEQRHSWNFLGILFFLPVSLAMLVWWLFQKRKG
jgi:hypothetical protein